MAYRDDSEPLRERALTLSRELEQVRMHARALASEESALADELARVSRQLHPPAAPPELPSGPSNGFLVAIVGSAACALLAFCAIARIMTSEIAPFEIQTAAKSQASTSTVSSAPIDIEPGTTVLDDDEHVGFLRIEAPAGTRIYDSDRFLGTAPLLVLLPDGTHEIRAVAPSGVTCTKLGLVGDRSVGALRFE
jgi:hypothetical protein